MLRGATDTAAGASSVGLDADTFCHRLRTEHGVLMFPGTAFGARWASYVRISLLQPEGTLVEAVARIARFVARVRQGDPRPTARRRPGSWRWCAA